MISLAKAIRFVTKNLAENKTVICAWQSYNNFFGVCVIVKNACNNMHNFPSYNVYVCNRRFFIIRIVKIIPIGGPLSKEHVISLASVNLITWISEDHLDL
jgi:hypothetical protein